MNITAFNGSPRGKSGNTSIIVSAFLEGAKQAGAEVKQIYLADKKIHPCSGCFTCWSTTPGKCVHRDDMDELIPQFTACDVVVWASPLYVDNITGMMKNFIDRLVPVGDPHMTFDSNGQAVHVPSAGKSPKFVVISNCGFPEQEHFQVLQLLFRRMARNFHSEVIGEIYRSEGELLRKPSLLLKPIIWSYLQNVKQAGKEIVQSMRISEETASKLDKPLIPIEMYLKGANQYWDESLKK